jgi:hypothetical protein
VPGTYIINLWARNVGASEAYQARVVLSYVLNADPPVATATLIPLQTSPQSLGGSLTFEASSTGGGATHEYQLLVYSYSGDATWRVVDGFKTGTNMTWNTASEVPGTYLVQLRVRNVGSISAFEARQFLQYSLGQ